MGKGGILGGQRQKGVLKRQQVTLVPLRGEFMSTIRVIREVTMSGEKGMPV